MATKKTSVNSNTTAKQAQAIVESSINELSASTKQAMQDAGLANFANGKLAQPLTLPLADTNPFFQFTPQMNEFVTAMVNKISKTIITVKRWENPLAELKTDSMPLGDTAEEFHINPAKAEVMDWDGETLHKRVQPDAAVAYYRINREEQYTVSVQLLQIVRGFTSWRAMAELVDYIVAQLYNGNAIDEYWKTKTLIAKGINDNKMIINNTFTIPVDEDSGKLFTKYIRQMMHDFTVPSTKWNAYTQYPDATAVNPNPRTSWVRAQDMLLIITSAVEASLDVDVLAYAFNMSNAQIQQRIVVVDNFNYIDDNGDEVENPNVFAVLCDKALFRIFDQDISITDWANPKGRYWNYFLTVIQAYGLNPFANAVAFVAPAVVNKTGLISTINQADALVEADYTPASWTSMQNVLTSAKAVRDNASATQEEVDTANINLKNAIDALVPAT